MSKEQQGQEMFELPENHSSQIGTEILDASMPSNLDFENGDKAELEGQHINPDCKYVKGKLAPRPGDEIRSFSIKGKCIVEQEPKYKPASRVKEHVATYEVRAYNEDKSGGLKSLWESVVGYVKREVHIEGGYLYIFEQSKEGYITHAAIPLKQLFKIFCDAEESKVRLVFHENKEHVTTKNFQVKSTDEFVEKIAEEASKIGLIVLSE